MPIDCHIDTDHDVVYTTLKGRVTFDEFSDYLKKLAEHPDFRSDMRELFDGDAAETDEFGINQIMSFKHSHVWGPGARRALTTTSDLVYGLFRMFQTTADGEHGEIKLFRDREEACRWLGVPYGGRTD